MRAVASTTSTNSRSVWRKSSFRPDRPIAVVTVPESAEHVWTVAKLKETLPSLSHLTTFYTSRRDVETVGAIGSLGNGASSGRYDTAPLQ